MLTQEKVDRIGATLKEVPHSSDRHISTSKSFSDNSIGEWLRSYVCCFIKVGRLKYLKKQL